jgi:hypothetical protein
MTTEKVIIHASRDNLYLAARAARSVLASTYEWPSDGIAVLQYVGGPEEEPVACFAVKRNKGSITVWEQPA